MKIKKCFIDVETTGVDVTKHSVHHIASIMLDENGKGVDYISLKFTPYKSEYEQSALDIVGLSYDELFHQRKLTSAKAFQLFLEYLEKHVNKFDRDDKLQFLAYNSEFDERFVREWFNEHSCNYYASYFWHPSICIMKECAWLLRDQRNVVPNFKLASLCKFAKIEFDEDAAHDAMYDIRKTVELYKAIE